MSNNFKELAQLVKKRKAKINALYEEVLQTGVLKDELLNAFNISTLKQDKTAILAILRRFVDLKEENLVEEFKKAGFSQEKIIHLKHQIYDEVRKFYEKEHKALIKEIEKNKLLEDFFLELVKGIHNIGLVMNEFAKLFEKYDVLLTPTAPTVAFDIGSKSNNPLEMYLADICTVSVNIAGLPGLSLPCGVDSSGMPIGMQLIGNRFSEETLLNAGYTFEQDLKFREKYTPEFKGGAK